MRFKVDAPGAHGIIKDIPDHALPPEAWSDGSNVHFEDGKAGKVKGYVAVFDPPTVAPYWLLPAFAADEFYWIYPSLTKAYVTDGSTHKDITRSVGGDYAATAALGWNGGTLNGIPILNNGVDVPQYWDKDFATPGRLAPLTAWPPGDLSTSCTARVMRPFGNFLFALDLTEDGTRFEDALRWSHSAEPGSIPSSWDITDATKDAGRVSLSQTVGPLLEAAPLGETLVVYKEQGVFGVQYIGGRSIHRTWPMFKEIGIWGQNCALEVQRARQHLVLTPDADLVLHDGVRAQSIVTGRWKRWLVENLSSAAGAKAFLVNVPGGNDVWICIPTGDSTYPDTALTLHVPSGSFGIQELPSPAFIATGIIETSLPDETWDVDEDVWDDDDSVWDEKFYNSRNIGPLMAVPGATKLYQGEATEQKAGANMSAFVERLGLGVIGRDRAGQPTVDFTRMKFLRRIWLRMTSTGPVNVSAASQMIKGGTVTYQGPFSFDPATQEYLDFSISGRLLGIRIESNANISWELESYELEFELGGVF